jgi:hypothetical protein
MSNTSAGFAGIRRVTVKSIVFAFGIIIFAFKATRTKHKQKLRKKKRLKTGVLEMQLGCQGSRAWPI